ncbi:MAG: hypothetical protein AB7O62_10050 [Pirellulales bacterium]
MLDPQSDWRIHEFAESPRPGQESWALLRGDEGIILATGGMPYDDHWNIEKLPEDLRSKMQAASAWLAVETIESNPATRETLRTLARQLAQQLTAEKSMAAYLPGEFQLFLVTEEFLVVWRNSRSLDPFRQQGIYPPFHEESAEGAEARAAINARRQFNKDLRQAALQDRPADGPPLEVLVKVGNAIRHEQHWLRVRQAQRSYGGVQVDAEWDTPSPMFPDWRAGMPVRVDQYEIQGWRVGDAPASLRPGASMHRVE